MISLATFRPATARAFRVCACVLILALFAGCTSTAPVAAEPSSSSQNKTISFLAFGDSGYHLDYPSKRDVKEPYTRKDDFFASRVKADGSGGSMDPDRRFPDIEISPGTGGYVLSSGLHRVSAAMRETCASQSCDFALMMGDNIYPSGADGIDDRDRFGKILLGPFSGLGSGNKDFAIYAALGNHDWKTSREGALAQLGFMESTLPFYMEGFFYSVIPPGSNGDVEVFVLDTQLLLASTDVYSVRMDEEGYEIDTGEVEEPWEWVVPQNDAEREIAAWLENALRSSKAKWKIVTGHHPFWSSAGGKYAQSIALRELILPTLCRYADAYLAGHEHTLEVHQYDCAQATGGSSTEVFPQIVSGAAGKQRGVNSAFSDSQDQDDPELVTLFTAGFTWGYSNITLSGDEMKVDMISVDLDGAGTPVYSHTFKNRSDTPAPAAMRNSNRPNVILLMSDDQGWGDTSYNGHPVLQTPNLDMLAAQGMVFNRFYAAAPVCSPTRASVITGRHPKRMGIDNPNSGGMPAEEITVAEIARDLGYLTAHFGKWHLGTMTHSIEDSNRGAPGNTEDYKPPWENGYDVVFATEAKVPTFDPMDDPENRGSFYGTAYWTGAAQPVPHTDPSLLGDDSRVLMDRVIPFIENAVTHDKPFFTTVWLHSPHDPVVADPADQTFAEIAGLTQDQRTYYTIVTEMDRQIGRLWKTLEEQGILENTLIAFNSDNGPSPVYAGSAGGLRGYKFDLYEGGVRVPGIVVWPGTIPAGSSSDAPVITHDYLPTLLDIWQVDEKAFPDDRPIDGQSMVPLFHGESPAERDLAFAFTKWNASSDRELPERMALTRGGDKLISQDYGDSYQLYDLNSDPAEEKDLAAKYPEKVESMREAWSAWFESTLQSRSGADYPE